MAKKSTKKTYILRPSDFVENFLYLNGKPFSLENFPWMRTIYDIDVPETTMCFSRQTSKSTTIANMLIQRAIVMPSADPRFDGGYKLLYVAPVVDQARVFSHDRLESVINDSSFVKSNFTNSSTISNVFNKYFLNGSRIQVRYALLTADRVRGISTNFIAADEVQDMNLGVLDIVLMALTASPVKRKIFSGTPKRSIGTLAHMWHTSTRNEWFVKCEGCNKHNYIDQDNIGLKGLICRYCGKILTPRNGQWVRTNSASRRDDNGAYINEGFRISAPLFFGAPWVDWATDIIKPMNEKSEAIFKNEYLGLEHDTGTAPISEEEIKACCTGGKMRHEPDTYTQSYPTFLGIDYGPVNSTNSYTLHMIIQNRGNGVFEVLNAKRYVGPDANFANIHDSVPKDYYKWECQLIGADNGYGDAANAEIRERINNPDRLIAFQHLGNQKQRTNWNTNMQAYTLGRNKIMTEFFQRIKNKKFIFPDWIDFQDFAKDILAISLDYNEETQKYKYINSAADDAYHALIYGTLVAELHDRVTNPNYNPETAYGND